VLHLVQSHRTETVLHVPEAHGNGILTPSGVVHVVLVSEHWLRSRVQNVFLLVALHSEVPHLQSTALASDPSVMAQFNLQVDWPNSSWYWVMSSQNLQAS